MAANRDEVASYGRWVRRPPRTARHTGRRIARRHRLGTVPTGKRKLQTHTSNAGLQTRPPVVGGAPWCLRGRSEYQLKFAKRTQNSRAGIYCGMHYSCRTPHDPTHSRRRAADREQERRNRPCLQGIARQPPLQQFVFRTGPQRRPIRETVRKASQSRHRG